MVKPFHKAGGKTGEEQVIYVPLSKIIRNPFLMRKNFEEEELWELAQSIRAYGVIQPVILRRQGDLYQLVSGERRYRACLLLGLAEIPALVRDMDDEKAAVVALVENLQKKELNFLEEAYGYNVLMEVFGLTPEEIENKTGRKEAEIVNRKKLLKLAPEVQKKIMKNRLDENYAHVLLKINSPLAQLDIIDEITAKNLTVEETKALVEKHLKDYPSQDTRGKYGFSLVVRDERIFLNTIRETVRRARQTGIDMCMEENSGEEFYQIVVRVNKRRPVLRGIVG